MGITDGNGTYPDSDEGLLWQTNPTWSRLQLPFKVHQVLEVPMVPFGRLIGPGPLHNGMTPFSQISITCTIYSVGQQLRSSFLLLQDSWETWL